MNLKEKIILEEIIELLISKGFHSGRMISGSKSGYETQYRDNLVVFNGNIVSEKFGKIWYGDLDLTKDYIALKEIADKIKDVLYVLREMDARFGSENNPINELIKKAVWNTDIKEKPTLKWYRNKNGF